MRKLIASLFVLVVSACDAPRQTDQQARPRLAGEDHPIWLAISPENKARYRMGLFNDSARLVFTADYPSPFGERYPRHLIVEEGAFEVATLTPTTLHCSGLATLSSTPSVTGRPPHGMFFTEQDDQYLAPTGTVIICVNNLDRCLFFLAQQGFSAQTTIDRDHLCDWEQLDHALRADMDTWFAAPESTNSPDLPSNP